MKHEEEMAHYNLALNYWHMREYGPALMHARSAMRLGISKAEGIELALTARLSLGLPRVGQIVRRKPSH